MKIVAKQILGYFLVSLFIGSLSILGAYLINRNIIEIVKVGNPKLSSALEIEINSNELLQSIQSYNQTMGRKDLFKFDKSISEYEKFRDIYSDKIKSSQEKLLIESLDNKVQNLILTGREVIKLKQDIEAGHDLVWGYLGKMNRILDDDIQDIVNRPLQIHEHLDIILWIFHANPDMPYARTPKKTGLLLSKQFC